MMSEPQPAAPILPAIPVVDVGPQFGIETLRAYPDYATRLMDDATRGIPRWVLNTLDQISRRWLVTSDNTYLDEIDAVVRQMNRPGGYFLSVNYEWGCTTSVRPAPDGQSARLTRVLDWRTPGLGRYVLAAEVDGKAGPYTTLTWPGFTGVLQASASGRFAAAINQAPMIRAAGGVYALDWFVNKCRLWKRVAPSASHVLRDVFETASSFAEARARLSETPIATPVIFSLVGTKPEDVCVIERLEAEYQRYDGVMAIANMWQSSGWNGRARGEDNVGRTVGLMREVADMRPPVDWLKPPVLNDLTRLAMVADPRLGTMVVQGFENREAATAPLRLESDAAAG